MVVAVLYVEHDGLEEDEAEEVEVEAETALVGHATMEMMMTVTTMVDLLEGAVRSLVDGRRLGHVERLRPSEVEGDPAHAEIPKDQRPVLPKKSAGPTMVGFSKL